MQVKEKFNDIRETLIKEDFYTHIGKVKRISGLMIEAHGGKYKIGEICEIKTASNKTIRAEVVLSLIHI